MIPVITYSYIARSSSTDEGVKPDVFGQYQPDVKSDVFHSAQGTKHCEMLAVYKTEHIQTMDKPARIVPCCQGGSDFKTTDFTLSVGNFEDKVCKFFSYHTT